MFKASVQSRHRVLAIATEKRLPTLGRVTRSIVAIVFLSCGLVGAQNAETSTDLDNAWAIRRAGLSSGRFEWREELILNRGAIIPEKGYGMGYAARDGRVVEPVPLEATSHEYSRKLTFSGDKLRYTENEPLWNTAVGRFTHREYIVVWDGRTGKELTRNEPTDPAPDKGNVYYTDARMWSNMAILPLRLYCRPPVGSEPSPYAARILEATGRKLIDENVEWIEYRSTQSTAMNSTYVWVAPTYASNVVRIVKMGERDHIFRQTDIVYENDAEHKWVPAAWTVKEFLPSGRITRQVNATVTKAECNTTFDDDHFALTFPNNTLVVDHDSTRRTYIHKTSGKERPITLEHLRSRKAYVQARDGTGGRYLGAWIALSFAIAIGTLLLWRWVGRRQQDTDYQ